MPIQSLLTDAVTQGLASRISGSPVNAEVFVDRPALTAEAFTAAAASIGSRLGWLQTPRTMPARVPEVERVCGELVRDGLTDIYLLGMGGSSLCAEVLRDMQAPPDARARFSVLDTTDDVAVRNATSTLEPERACFIVASKSGSTIEVTSLERHFRLTLQRTLPEPGRHFVAITDPDTSLVAHATANGYRHTFINPADIGGRYSVLSLFGLVPARLLGVSPVALLRSAEAMAAGCARDVAENPGLALGVFMAGHAARGRDKLTLLTSRELAPFGVWVEQLVAESTGKLGLGVLPVVDEPIGAVGEYGADRAFVVMATTDDVELGEHARRLEAAGHPVLGIAAEPSSLGAEFFRWEFATAVAGAVLRLNPFDEPDVRKAKVFTKAQLDAHGATGTFATSPAFTPGPGYRQRASGTAPSRDRHYVAILDYLPADRDRSGVARQLRADMRKQLGIATTYGIGPRYLHSTGQYHKGGPNTGTFLIVTAEPHGETAVPEEAYGFSVLKRAQAFGDFDALADAGRHVVHCHVDDPTADWATMLDTIVRHVFLSD